MIPPTENKKLVANKVGVEDPVTVLSSISLKIYV